MKKIFKSRLFFLVLGVIVTSFANIVFAYSNVASDTEFNSTISIWQDHDVKSAIDYLRDKAQDNEEVTLILNNAASNTSVSFEPGIYRYFIVNNVHWNSSSKIYDAAINYLKISSVTNATYDSTGETGRDGSKSGVAARSYKITPDGSGNTITVYFNSSSDGTSVYGIK